MLNDRVLVQLDGDEGERRSTGGILIPATAQMSQAPGVGRGRGRRAERPDHGAGDQVLFNPEDRYEVEVRGDDYIILRERDIHAVAADAPRRGQHRALPLDAARVARTPPYDRPPCPPPPRSPRPTSSSPRSRYDADGLVPAIVQEHGTGAGADDGVDERGDPAPDARAEGRTVFWSRSRQEVWRKGDTSGDRQYVREASYDCDGDTLLFVVEQEGKGACHTGEHSCFFRVVRRPTPSA